MTSLKPTRIFAAVSIAATLALAGCGGGGSSMVVPAAQMKSVLALVPASQYPDTQYVVTPLVSDDPAVVPATHKDPNLINGWGLAASATGPWWTSNNGTGTSSLYDGAGNVIPRVFSVAGYAQGANMVTPRGGQPTGIVFHSPASGKLITSNGTKSGPALFIFANEDGTISGWNPVLGTDSPVMIDKWSQGAVYKGLAIVGDTLYATNFHAGTVEVYDGDLKPVMMEGAFKAPAEIPGDFAPYGIQAIGTEIYVTYAKQDAAKHDEVKGEGLGAVVAFETSGKLIRTVAVGEKRNAPWGVALAPADFGRFSNQLLVGQFGDGSVLAFPLGANEASGGEWLEVANGRLVIDGLWGIAFGYGNANSGPKNTLYFAAGPMGETHGLFGSITLAAPSADMSASPKDY